MRLLHKAGAMRIYSLLNSTARTLVPDFFGNSSVLSNSTVHQRIAAPAVFTQLRAHVETMKTAEASSGLVVMFVVGMIAICLFCFFSVLFPRLNSASKDSMDVDEDSELKAAQYLSEGLRRYIRKLPVTRKSKTGHSKERYIAVIPGDRAKQVRRSDGEYTVAQKWEGGKVAWWQDLSSFQKREAPKGEVALKNIVGADGGNREKYDYCEVEINYTQGQATKRLLLFLPSQFEASEWASDFTKLLRLVRPKANRSSAKSPTWTQAAAETVRKFTSSSVISNAIEGFNTTFLPEKDESEDELTDSDSDRGN